MLDGLIALLETIVAMEKLNDITDGNNDGVSSYDKVTFIEDGKEFVQQKVDYGKDIIFIVDRIIKLKNNTQIAILKGLTMRIKADSYVDDLEIIGRWINKLDRSINLNRMSDYQKSCFLTNLISIHLKFVGISSDNEVINILNFFDDEGDILDGINNSKKDTS